MEQQFKEIRDLNGSVKKAPFYQELKTKIHRALIDKLDLSHIEFMEEKI